MIKAANALIHESNYSRISGLKSSSFQQDLSLEKIPNPISTR